MVVPRGGGHLRLPPLGVTAVRTPLRTPLRTPRFLETPETEGRSTRGVAKTPLNAPKLGRLRGALLKSD
jgi:hypothetical protein